MPKSKATKNRFPSNSKGKSGSPKRETQGSPSATSYSALKKRFDAQAEELREALEQQTMTSEILRVIASSPTELQPVLDTVAENAARLCDATDALIVRVDGNNHIPVASFGVLAPTHGIPTNRESPAGRAILDRQTIHIRDLAVEVETEFPAVAEFQKRFGHRTMLATPLLREGVSIGAILIRRLKLRPFTDKQIALLKTFADQAVIAIENTRLFQELKQKSTNLETSNSELREALEQQAATSEILRVIASWPSDLQRVLDVIAENAARLCDARDTDILRVEGDSLRRVASYGPMRRVHELPITRGIPGGRAVIDCQTVHVHDLQAEIETDFPEARTAQQLSATRTILAAPLLREGVAIGCIAVRRMEVRPFSDKQIALLKTFADQAMIAIENVRLFQELKESLEQQTATSEILGVIASSPTDIQPVLDVVAENAARLCGANDALIRRLDGDALLRVAHYGQIPSEINSMPLHRGSVVGRAVINRQTIHIHDLASESKSKFPEGVAFAQRFGRRTVLATPLMRHDVPIGAIIIRRLEVRPFSDKEINLLKTFASQAVIAIENVRLFKELQERNRDLTEALEQQTATSEVLKAISRSTFDLQPVLETLVENATKLCGADRGFIYRPDGELLRMAVDSGASPELRAFYEQNPVPITRGSNLGRTFLERRTVHIEDCLADPEYQWAESQRLAGYRTLLGVPLLREGVPLGIIGMWRQEVRPFTDKQIELVTTFADQAVIAIENVRLFKEIQERNAELREALEHQTATAEVLGIISRSPTDVQPVLDAIVGSAARVCGIDDVSLRLQDGSSMISRAHIGPIPVPTVDVSSDAPRFRWVREHGTLHIPDVRAQNDFPLVSSNVGWRTHLSVPLRQQGELVGALTARRTEVRPFTPAQIKLLETFADQAVIAIENVRLFLELKEALEQQTATGEILGVIASSPTDIQPVLDVVAENAARLCDANDASIFRLGEGMLRRVARFGSLPASSSMDLIPANRDTLSGRATIERQTIQVRDLQALLDEFPESRGSGARTMLATPLLREGESIGCINIRRMEIRPFTDKQIALLKTFADQAVIAIENVRLFQEIQERNAELREALEHQTATAEVLSIISRSPTDVQPVLDAIVESAARVCGIDDVVLRLCEGDSLVSRSHIGPTIPTGREEISTDTPQFRWMREHGTLHIPDVGAQNDFPTLGSISRTILIVPLRQQGEIIGTLSARRIEVRPFTSAQIKLLETFADQAVIALENVRLFQELKESLEQQTATSEILGVIASSPTDVKPVLDVVVANAARLCDSNDAQLRMIDGNVFRLAASYGPVPIPPLELPISRVFPTGRAVLERQTIHVHDVAAEVETEYPDAKPLQQLTGSRTVLATPLLREGVPIGAILIRRLEMRPFTDQQIALLKTFADQAVIAIENVRLFQELEARTRELAQSVGELRALGDVSQAVSSTLELETVLATIVSHAVQLSGTDCGVIYEYDEAAQEFHLRASHRMEEEAVEAVRSTPVRLGEGATGRAVTIRAPVQIPDILDQREYTGTRARPLLTRLGYRSLLVSAAIPRAADHGGFDGLAATDRRI